MSKVFVNIGLSLDGYMAPEGMALEHWEDPEYENWGAKWGALMAWLINQQRDAAGTRDVRISGGADVIQQYLNLGVLEELEIALAPILFGSGRRLFENLREPLPEFRIETALHGTNATHVRYVRE